MKRLKLEQLCWDAWTHRAWVLWCWWTCVWKHTHVHQHQIHLNWVSVSDVSAHVCDSPAVSLLLLKLSISAWIHHCTVLTVCVITFTFTLVWSWYQAILVIKIWATKWWRHTRPSQWQRWSGGLNCSSIVLDFCCIWSDRLALQTFKNTFTITVIGFVWETVGIISSLDVFLWSSRLCVSVYFISLELWSCESTEDLEAARQEKASAGLIAVTDKVECSFSSLSFFCVCVFASCSALEDRKQPQWRTSISHPFMRPSA